ncbi:tRNA dimethylallyltransferase [Breznakia blatticola]|uniref:tRNA dimethylallyltransferase n=1 Tax=Breznakia blatticola TaxID=1754012 RepID=A0A4R7ZAH4_9FIRM|nr:tRNA (adenosine(37)-N6)-dimethylallyltransferase MiaA [Breznakia blatticola]TDW11816.1 tRNA dimethylallyltransferase [Breznakia blatticola]
MDKVKVLAVIGPTGVGKSKMAIELAKKFNGEIISGDAYQVYKQLSIGSAKITPEEMDGITHYLVDCYDYEDTYNVKIFQEQARKYISEIQAKGKLPIICGGTGLYIKAALYDYVFEEEQEDEAYSKLLNSLSDTELYERLKQEDIESAQALHPNNTRRIKRALMMNHLGHKKSERLQKQNHEMLYDAYILGLTVERSELYKRIDARVVKMMDMGLLEELQDIVKDDTTFALQSMRGIGYKEWQSYFQKEASMEETISLIQKNTRNFAKRQYTWFNNQMDVHWFDIRKPNIKDDIQQQVQNFIEG